MKTQETLISRNAEITSDFLKLVDTHIDDLLHQRVNRRFHASDFAKLLFIHPRHLTNTIHLVTGISPCDIVEGKLIHEIKVLLKDKTLAIADIGIRFGFNDAANFTKFFKGTAAIDPAGIIFC
jgi:AraC family transcriptional regulator, regulatory protein of adaptative response / methylphosphotriester-DNA alkyltransferase methyltransferase